MTQTPANSNGREPLPEILVFGADDSIAGSFQELMVFGPTWRTAAGETLLQRAAMRCSLPWIRELVTRGWDPFVRGQDDGESLLHLVVGYQTYRDDPSAGEACLLALIRMGIEIDTPDANGDTPLHYAASSKNVHAVQLLLQLGARVDAVGNHSSTPLDAAVRANLPETVRLLVNAGADVNHRNESGGTPLLWSAGISPEITRILLAAGADPQFVDDEGDTPLALAEKWCPESAELIRAALSGKDIDA